MTLQIKHNNIKQCAQLLGRLVCCFFCVFVQADTVLTDSAKSDHSFNSQEHQKQSTLRVEIKEPTGELALSQVLALVLLHNPELSAFSQEIRAREAILLQANLHPNPVFDVQASNFGNHKFTGADGEAITLMLSQRIELGGKRTARVKAATFSQKLAQWDYEAQRVKVLTQATQAHIHVLITQKKVALLQQKLNLAYQMLKVASAKVRAGSVIPLEEIKAKVVLASAKIEWGREQRKLSSYRKRLAASWGSVTPLFTIAKGHLDIIQKPPTLQSLQQQLEKNPALARGATEIYQRQALVSLEKSKAIPDITLSFGTNAYLDGDNYNMNAGISMPIPIFDRNQGDIRAAQYRLNKTESEYRATKISLITTLHFIYQQLETAYLTVLSLRQEIIPSAESAFKIANRGYRLGEFDFLNVLDTQRTLFAVKEQYLRAQAEYHLNVTKIEQLIGVTLNTSELTQ